MMRFEQMINGFFDRLKIVVGLLGLHTKSLRSGSSHGLNPFRLSARFLVVLKIYRNLPWLLLIPVYRVARSLYWTPLGLKSFSLSNA